MSVSLSNSLEDEFGIPVPVSELISGPTIGELANGVFRELVGSSAEGNQVPSAEPSAAPVVTMREPVIHQNEQASPEVRTNKIRSAPTETLSCEPVPAIKLKECVGVAEAKPAAFKSVARAKLENVLQRVIMAELGFLDPIDLDQPLNEVGLDFLRSVTLSNTLEDAFGIPVSVTELISGPTIKQLIDYLVDELSEAGPTIAEDQNQRVGSQEFGNSDVSSATAIETRESKNNHSANPAVGINEETLFVSGGDGVGGEKSRSNRSRHR